LYFFVLDSQLSIWSAVTGLHVISLLFINFLLLDRCSAGTAAR
jgi:hypothetical protein